MGGFVSSFQAAEERADWRTAPGTPGVINQLNPKRKSAKERRGEEAEAFAAAQKGRKDREDAQKARAKKQALTRGDPNTFTNQNRLGEPTLGRQRLLS